MRVPVAFALCAAIAAAVACSVGGGLSGGGAVDAAQALDPSTEPIQVQLTTDPSLAITATIPVEGGTLTAASADGTRFTLTVPSGALVQPTTITMTPLASMEGLPFGEGAPMAVQLEPSGLTFFDFVTLRVEPGADVPIDQQIPIGTSSDNSSLEMPFVDISTGVLQLKLLHFSSAGAEKGLLADLEPWRQRLGGDVESRLRSVIARELLYYRQKQLAGEDAPIPQAFWDWVKKTWWENVMKPRLDAAGESCAAGRLAMETALSFERQAQLLGFGDDGHNLVQTVWDLLPMVARKCIQEEYELCRDEHVVHRMIPVLLTVERQIQLIGLQGTEMDQVMAEGENLARKCLHFELVFESSADGLVTSEGGSTTYTSNVEATVPIELKGTLAALDLHLEGSADLSNTAFDYYASTEGVCSSGEITGSGTFTVVSLTWDSVSEEASPPYGEVKDVQLTYAPGSAEETMVMRCPNLPDFPVPIPIWQISYQSGHSDEMTFGPSSGPAMPSIGSLLGSGGPMPGGGGMPTVGGAGQAAPNGPTYEAKPWDMQGGELFAEKEWDESTTVEGATVSESGSFKLYHRPQ